MSDINQSFVDRVRYTLFHDIMGSIVINEPVGWKEDDKEYARNEDYHGVFAKFSNSSVFVGEAAEFINLVKELYGIQTDLRLTKDVRHPKTDVWEQSYFGYLDMGTWTKEKKGVSLKFNSGGIEEIIKTRESEEVELDRLTTMDGDTIAAMPFQTVEYNGRRIFLKSSLENAKAPDNYAYVSIYSNGNTRNHACAIPLKIVSNSHEELSDVPNQSIGYEDNGSANMMFFLIAENNRRLLLDIDLTFTTNVTRFDDVNHGNFSINITIYKNGSAFEVKSRTRLFYVNLDNARTQLGGTVNELWVNYPPITHYQIYHQYVDLLEGESMAIETIVVADLGSNTSRGHVDVRTENCIAKIKIDEDSIFEKTFSKFYLPYEAFERLVQIYTGKKGILKSNALGRLDLGYQADGEASLIGLNHGFWVRGFDALPASTDDEQNLFKPLTTSIRNFMDSFSTVANLGMGIERSGYSEKIIVEDKKYFYNRNVTIKLPNQVKNVKRTMALKYIYSGIELGYDKGGSYDEAQGLDEYNGKNNFTTIITKTKNIFSRISNYRADSYGKEFCRRKPFMRYPSLDTQYDSDIFLNDLKRGPNNVFNERLWQDDFSQPPTGIYSAETATNLRLSPFNLLLKHGWEIMAGLTKNITDYIRYSNSTGNSTMTTRLDGHNEYSENGSIICSELERARYESELIEFDHKVDYEINKLLDGFTIFNGEKVYNVYGLIEFLNEDNEIEKGWLMSVKPNKEGKWQLLKFNKR